jgi:uncharacterized protein (TIGR03067 family)
MNDNQGFSTPYKIDPAKKPKHLDIDAGGRLPPLVGIFKLEANKLYLALAPTDRPDRFRTDRDSRFVVYELKRVNGR